MKAITEAYLRDCFREAKPECFTLQTGMILTPAARQFLQEQRIELNKETKNQGRPGKPAGKQEELTQLYGKTLVRKDHPRIALRGRLDSLQADILMLHARCGAGSPELSADLTELLAWAREILRAEVLETAPTGLTLAGMSTVELRERSHNPRKFYNIDHVLPDMAMAPEILELNRLRAIVREIELLAVAALADDGHPAAREIIEALNRMSSAVYVLMLKYISRNHERN